MSVRWQLGVVAAGTALLASSFLPLWATYRIPGLEIVAPETVHQNAWAAYGLTMQLALGLTVAATVLAVALALGRSRPQAATTLLALSAAALLLLVWQIVRGPQGSADPSGYGIGRGLLLFTGGALAAVMTYGSYRAAAGNRRGGPPSGMMGAGPSNRTSLGE